MDEPTYYELLGVAPTATTEEIRAAYRRLLRAAHPDAGGTAGLFRTVQYAYDVLSDPTSRADYDAELRRGHARSGGRAPAWGADRGARRSGESPGTARERTESGREQASSWGDAGRTHDTPPQDSPYPPGSGRASLYRPMERPHRMPTTDLGAIFDPPLFAGEDSAGARRRRGRGPLGAHWNRGSERREPTAATDLLPMNLLRQRTIGVPGAGYDDLSRAAELEREAARRTDELLEVSVMPGYPAMRLVHDLRDPATREAIIDHAVVIGDRVILIDSVMVTSSRVTWDGTTLRSDSDPEVTPGVARLLEQARLWLDPWRVDLVVVVHAASGKLAEPEIVQKVERAGALHAAVMGPLDLVSLAREAALLEARTHVVNVRLLRAVLKLSPGVLG